MRGKLLVVLGATLLTVISAPLFADPQAIGNEFRLNTDGESLQHNPVAAYNSAGHALVVWENDQDGLRCRFVAADGSALGGEIGLVANSNLPSIPGQGNVTDRKNPAVVFLPSSKFLLFWTEERATDDVTFLFENRVVTGRDVFMQRFTAAGAPDSQPQRLNQTTAGFHSRPQAVLRSGGDVLVVWEADAQQVAVTAGDGIFARLLAADGTPSSNEFRLNSVPQRAHNAAVANDRSNGRTLVTWDGREGNGPEIIGRLLAANAVPLGPDIAISSAGNGPQRRSSVASDGHGNFMVVWQGWFGDVYHARVFGQFVGQAGNLVGPQVQISKGYGQAQISPSVALAPKGNFLVVWMEFEQWFPIGMAGVEINNLAAPLAGEFWVNQKQIGYKLQTSIGANGAGNFLIPYESYYSGDNLGISARLLMAN
jgi:hypothetical protein